jgi:hypothetical protein
LSEDDPKELGFRDPPDKVTCSCLGYMARVTELREFISFFFGIVKSSDAFAKSLTPESAKAFSTETEKYRIGKYSFSVHRQFVNEMMLSRAVETFDLYVLTVLREIFAAKPEMLKSETAVDAATVIELRNFDDIVFYLAERKLHELSFKPLSELRKYIESRTGIDLFSSEAEYEVVLLASEVRNLIAHNDCRINDVFKRRTEKLKDKDKFPVSDSGKFVIEDEWVRRASYALDNVVFNFDEAVAKKFDIPPMNRMTSFIWRN